MTPRREFRAASASRGPTLPVVLTLATITAWGVTSLVESNAAIFVAALVLGVSGALAALLVGRRAPAAATVFAVAYALRSLAALVAFYHGKGQAYWVGGVGSDAVAYYETSFLDISDALFSQFSFKGFVAFNSFVTRNASSFDAAHYLCNLQGPIIAGALLAVTGYAVLRELRGERAARVGGAILAAHPAFVSIGAVLLRDSLVGCFGWALVLCAVRLFRARGSLERTIAGAIAVAALYALSQLRTQSMIVFVGLALVVLWFSTRPSPEHPGLPPLVRRVVVIGGGGAVVLAIALVIATGAVSGLDASYIQSAVQYRAENAAQGSLGASLGSGNLAVSTAMYSVLSLLAPFPFYAWSPESLNHPTGPLDYLVGIGGIVNQVLMGFAALGLLQALRRRDLLPAGVMLCITAFVLLTTLTGGDTIRYVAAHVYVLYLIPVLDGMLTEGRRRLGALALWLGGLVALYTVYETLKIGMGSRYTGLAALTLLLYLGAFLVRAWTLVGAGATEQRARGGHAPLTAV